MGAITAADKLLIHMPFALPQSFFAALAQRFPQLRVHYEIAPLVNQRLMNSNDLSDEAWDGVTILCVMPPPSAERMKGVKFVQLASAGSDLWIGHEAYMNRNITFCCTSGAHSVQIAEWAIGAWLVHSHNFRTFMAQADQEDWDMKMGLASSITDSPGLRMGILGYGSIGRQVARLAHALGMEIYVQTFSPRLTPESKKLSEYHVPGTSDPDGLLPAKWFSGSGPEAINHFLAQDLDVVLLSLPMSPETKGCIGAEQFKILGRREGRKPFIINVARGPIIDTPALIEALETGLVRGAALDVTDPEPLPKGHPLWKAPNVFITPHISWQSSRLSERVANIILENLERWDKGEPLLNQVKR